MIRLCGNDTLQSALSTVLLGCLVLTLLLLWMPVAHGQTGYGDCNVAAACLTCAPTCAAAQYCPPDGGPCDCRTVSLRLICAMQP